MFFFGGVERRKTFQMQGSWSGWPHPALFCRRTVPGTGCVSLGKDSSKGLNTESSNPQRASATVLAELAAGQHCREETHGVYPGSGPSWRGKTPTSCFCVLHCLESLQYKGASGARGGCQWLWLAKVEEELGLSWRRPLLDPSVLLLPLI